MHDYWQAIEEKGKVRHPVTSVQYCLHTKVQSKVSKSQQLRGSPPPISIRPEQYCCKIVANS